MKPTKLSASEIRLRKEERKAVLAQPGEKKNEQERFIRERARER